MSPASVLSPTIIVLIFDSGVLTFVEVIPLEYVHHVSYFLHRLIPSAEYARLLEGLLVIGAFGVGAALLRNLIQVTIATMLITDFLPYWSGYEATCEEPFKEGGVPYSETTAAVVATITFYFLVPYVRLHLYLTPATELS